MSEKINEVLGLSVPEFHARGFSWRLAVRAWINIKLDRVGSRAQIFNTVAIKEKL